MTCTAVRVRSRWRWPSTQSTAIGVEIVPEAIENAKRNALPQRHGKHRVLTVRMRVRQRRRLAKRGIDVLVVDPPRKGLDATARDAILKMQPPKRRVRFVRPGNACARCGGAVRRRLYAREGTGVSICSRELFMLRRLSCFPRVRSTRKRFGLSSLWKIWICPNFRMGQPTPRSRTMCWSIAG